MADSLPKITLDTNCVINLLDGSSETATSVEALNELIRLGLSNKIEIAVTTRVEADLSRDLNLGRKTEMLGKLAMMPVVGTVARWDISCWDSGDVWGGGDTTRLLNEIQQIVFPGLQQTDKRFSNKINDVDHLLGHLINGRDIFVTDDGGILKKDEPLKAIGLVVLSPEQCVEHYNQIQKARAVKVIASDDIDPAYRSIGFSGTARFDYSNNNGRFVIGSGILLFETRWTKASDEAIHAYTGSESIRSLALAKNVSAIADLGDVTRFDYSSRVRTPHEGQIIVWQNVNGFYAASKIIEIKDDSRGDEKDELFFEYFIKPDGSPNF